MYLRPAAVRSGRVPVRVGAHSVGKWRPKVFEKRGKYQSLVKLFRRALGCEFEGNKINTDTVASEILLSAV